MVFICKENHRQSGILPFADHPRFCRGLSQIFPIMYDRGTEAQQFIGLVMSEIHCQLIPTSLMVQNLSFHLSGMIADHRRNLGRVSKIEMLPILQTCPHSSQTIRDIYNFKFSLVCKIWDGRETVKFQTVWDSPDI